MFLVLFSTEKYKNFGSFVGTEEQRIVNAFTKVPSSQSEFHLQGLRH